MWIQNGVLRTGAVAPIALAIAALLSVPDVARGQLAYRVKDINTTISTAASNPSSAVQIGNITYFSADDGVNGTKLWRTELRQVTGYWIAQRNFASLHKQHQCASGYGFCDRGKQEHGVSLHRISLGRCGYSPKAAVQHNLAAPCNQNGCRMDLTASNAGLNDSGGFLESGRGHSGSLRIIHRDQRLPKEKGEHNL